MKCPLYFAHEAQPRPVISNVHWFECKACGVFGLGSVFRDAVLPNPSLFPPDVRELLSSAIRRETDRGNEVLVDGDNYEMLADGARSGRPQEHFFRWVKLKGIAEYQAFDIDSDGAIAARIGRPTDVLGSFLSDMVKQGYIERIASSEPKGFRLTPAGWEYAQSLSNP